jgi:diguanylate cyclase (GGDEF)-like protein
VLPNEVLALKGLKVAVVLAIALALLWMGRREPDLSRHPGWGMLLTGLFIVLFGDVLNLGFGDGRDSLWVAPFPEFTEVTRYGAWVLGNLLLALGFWRWLPLVRQLKQAQAALSDANEALEREVAQRTLELKRANEQLRHDLEERKRTERAMRHMAHHDALTDLPNRALFRDRLSHAMAQADRYHQRLAVLFLDLDRFKAINDTLGHNAGDQLLRIAAERLKGCVRECDTVARLGGDEFTVIVEDVEDRQAAAVVAQKIIDSFSQPFTLHGHEVFVTTSVGITLYPDDGEHLDTLLRNADAAMYRAKDCGRNNYQFYVPEMNTRARERLLLENALRRALVKEEFILHYQPRVDLRSGNVIGAEALLRWRHPERGLMAPDEFVPLLEETGLILPVGEWVLREACRQNRAWQDKGLPPVRVAVNLSVRQFLQRDLAALVASVLEETGLPPSFLELEITEELLLEHSAANAAALNRLRELGVHISIDDFGTGYSSLSYLKRLPIHTLKIDQSFVRDITLDSDGAAIVSAIIAMACNLRLNVLAEGVETEAQLAFLRAQGCNEIQGYSFSRPLDAEAFERLLREGRRMHLLQGLAGYYVNLMPFANPTSRH